MRKSSFTIIIIIVLGIVIIGGSFFVWKKMDDGIIRELIPSAQVYKSVSPTPSPIQSLLLATSYILPSEINLAIPFTVQAPNANWDEVHQEFCEEAAILMAISYVRGWDISSADYADQKMFEIKTFEEKRFGYYKDTTAEETATIIAEYYNYKFRLVYDPTLEDIKTALVQGKPVIAPAAGRLLGNPYFRRPGPLYHMLVIKGYTKTGNFITNDPGTRRGADFIYVPDVLMNAIHDWNGGDVENGKKVIIIVG